MRLKFQSFGHLMQRADLFEKTVMLGKIEVRRRREWQDILKVMKEKTYNSDYCTQQRSHSDMKEKSKALDKQKLREFSTTKPALQQMLKDHL